MTSTNKTMMGTYELARRLGVGGMGEVWLARQRGAAGFARDVAIKRLLPQAMEQRDVVQMFIEEAQITGRLRHPNVVNVIELGAAESGELYLVLEHVDGTGLHKLLRDPSTRPSPTGALTIARDVALALHAAHTLADDEGKDLGLVHRDVTPSNVMLDRHGHVKLMDFGIAKVRAKSNQTDAGIIKGKIAYLAPEQLKGSVDPRSDLFALGLVLWEIIAGRQVRSGSSDAVMMAKVALEAIPSLATAVPDAHPALIAAVDKACALEPDDRYQSGQEMAQAMLGALNALGLGGIEAAREELAELVKTAMKRDGEAVAGTTNASRTIDGDKPLALTLHSLVVQQDGGVTLSRPLTDDMIKVLAPTDARTSSGTRTVGGRRRKRSAALPLFAAGAAVAVVAGVFVARARMKPAGAELPVPGAAVTPASVATTGPTPAPIVTPPTPPGPAAATASADAGALATGGGAQTASTGRRPRQPSVRNARVSPTGGNPNVAPGTPATLGLSARPWAEITIDGQAVGETPIRRQLAPGRHTIVFRNPERDITRRMTVQLEAGETRVLSQDLTRAE